MITSRPKPRIYFDPTSDFGFKKLFGDDANKEYLIDFLNTLLPDYHQIESLTFLKSDQLPRHEEDRKAIFDIVCESLTGEKFIIEMQKAALTHMMDRAVYYSTFPVQQQAVKGPWNFKLSPTYLIGILAFSYDTDEKRWGKRKLLRTFTLRDEDGILMTENLAYKILQLAFFTKTEAELTTHFDKWCYFLKNLDSFDVLPNILNEPIFMKAAEAAKISNLSAYDYLLYEMNERSQYDMNLVKEEANRQGIEEGIEKGIETSTIKTVLTAYLKGFSAQQIGDFTEISPEKITTIIALYDDRLDFEGNIAAILDKMMR